MSGLVGNPKDRFSHNEAQLKLCNSVFMVIFFSFKFVINVAVRDLVHDVEKCILPSYTANSI